MFAEIFATLFLQATCVALRTANYEQLQSSNVTAIFGNDVTVREVTSLRGTGSGLLACAFACTELGGCRAFVREHERCILLGDATLPGEDVAAASLTEGKSFIKQGSIVCNGKAHIICGTQ